MNTIPCFLIPALVGLISGILGYLIGRMSSKNTSNSNENYLLDLENCNNKNNHLQAEIEKLKAEAHTTTNHVKIENFASTPTLIAFDSTAAKTVFGKTIKQDDLKIIEGIGPKIEELFQNSGISTWKLLSETSAENLKEILNSGGERFQIHNPGTWPKQALLAYEGKWQELKDWQETLDGGKLI